MELLAEYAPNVRRAVLHRQVITPLDLETEFGLTGGNIFHGEMTPDQLFAFRPLPGWAKHRTPIHRLYLCGSGAHPGGGVTGAPGHNAARIILRDRRRPHVLSSRRSALTFLPLLLGVLVMGVPSPGRGAQPPARLPEAQRIAALLEAVERSPARFIREGKDYSGAEGRRHLERKLRWAGDRIQTAEEFIEHVASRSSTTGRPYRVRLPDGQEVESAVWFRRKLAEIDAPR